MSNNLPVSNFSYNQETFDKFSKAYEEKEKGKLYFIKNIITLIQYSLQNQETKQKIETKATEIIHAIPSNWANKKDIHKKVKYALFKSIQQESTKKNADKTQSFGQTQFSELLNSADLQQMYTSNLSSHVKNLIDFFNAEKQGTYPVALSIGLDEQQDQFKTSNQLFQSIMRKDSFNQEILKSQGLIKNIGQLRKQLRECQSPQHIIVCMKNIEDLVKTLPNRELESERNSFIYNLTTVLSLMDEAQLVTALQYVETYLNKSASEEIKSNELERVACFQAALNEIKNPFALKESKEFATKMVDFQDRIESNKGLQPSIVLLDAYNNNKKFRNLVEKDLDLNRSIQQLQINKLLSAYDNNKKFKALVEECSQELNHCQTGQQLQRLMDKIERSIQEVLTVDKAASKISPEMIMSASIGTFISLMNNSRILDAIKIKKQDMQAHSDSISLEEEVEIQRVTKQMDRFASAISIFYFQPSEKFAFLNQEFKAKLKQDQEPIIQVFIKEYEENQAFQKKIKEFKHNLDNCLTVEQIQILLLREMPKFISEKGSEFLKEQVGADETLPGLITLLSLMDSSKIGTLPTVLNHFSTYHSNPDKLGEQGYYETLLFSAIQFIEDEANQLAIKSNKFFLEPSAQFAENNVKCLNSFEKQDDLIIVKLRDLYQSQKNNSQDDQSFIKALEQYSKRLDHCTTCTELLEWAGDIKQLIGETIASLDPEMAEGLGGLDYESGFIAIVSLMNNSNIVSASKALEEYLDNNAKLPGKQRIDRTAEGLNKKIASASIAHAIAYIMNNENWNVKESETHTA